MAGTVSDYLHLAQSVGAFILAVVSRVDDPAGIHIVIAKIGSGQRPKIVGSVDAASADQGIVATKTRENVGAIVATNNVVKTVSGSVTIVVDRVRNVIEIEALVLTAGAILRRTIRTRAEEDAVGHIGRRVGGVGSAERIPVVFESCRRADELSIEIDVDDVVVRSVNISELHRQRVLYRRIDAADKLARVVGGRIGAVAVKIAVHIRFADRNSDAGRKRIQLEEIVAVRPGGVAKINLKARTIGRKSIA